MSGSHPPLIARGDELRLFEECLDGLTAGRGAALLIAGEAGIGKTRLLEAMAELGRGHGRRVAWGQAWEGTEGPPFWPWREILQELQAQSGLRGEVRASAPWVSDATATSFERARFFDGARAFIAEVSAHAPVLVLLDDLHAMDPSSLVLAEFLVKRLREARVLFVGAYRDYEARSQMELGRFIGRLQRLARVLLPKRFDLGQVAELVQSELGTTTPGTVGMVYDASDGNPLFAHEFARLLAARGRLDSIPAGLQVVVRERLALLSPATVALLQIAAVVGRQFSVAVAAEAAGVLPAAIAESLAEAESAELVVAAGPGHFRFAHGAWAEALTETLPTVQRQRAHARVAEALQRGQLGGPDAPLAAIAHHLAQAGTGAAGAAWVAAEAAARQAYSRLAFEDAADFYEAALAGLVACAPRDTDHQLRLTLRLLAAHRRAGHAEEAWRVCQNAADWARSIGRPDILAEAALTWGAEFSPGEVDVRHVELLAESLASLPPGDSALRARVLARLAAARQPAADPAGPVAMAREAMAMVERVGEPAARLSVLNAAAEAVLCYVPPGERLALDEEVNALAIAAEDWPAVFQAKVRLAFTYIENGDLAGSERAVAEVKALADRFPQPRLRWPGLLLDSMQPLFAGKFDEARVAEEQVAALLSEAPDAEGHRALAVRKVVRMATQTDVEGLHDAVQECLALLPADGVTRDVITTWASAELGDADGTRAGLARLPEHSIEALWFDPSLGMALAESAIVAGDRGLAAAALERLAGHRGRPVMITLIGYAMWELADRVLLRLATLLGRWEDADAFATSGDQLARRLGTRAFAGRLWLDWATSLRSRGIDGERALGLARDAEKYAHALGMPGLLRSARNFVERSPTPESAVVEPGEPARATCVRDGEDWIVCGAGDTCRLRDGRGAQILAALLARPGQEVHVLDLIPEGGREDVVDRGDAGEILDGQARRAYRARLVDLRSEIDEAVSFNDVGRAQLLANEKEQIERALAEAVGLGGRVRRASDAGERARVNTQRRLADALRRISQMAPALGRHLATTVRTGLLCSYRPDVPRSPR